MLFIKSPIVSVEWLNQNLEASNLIILDASIKKVTSDDIQQTSKQIPSTRYFDIKHRFSNTAAPFPNTVSSQKQFINESRYLGINNASAIVVYDDKGIYSSARAWYLFKAFGFNNIAVLDGGLPDWEKARFKTEDKTEREFSLGDFIGIYNPDYFKFFNDIISISNNPDCLILDARSSDRFNGLVDEPRKGLRSGHIPNSLSLPFGSLLNGNCLKPKEELKSIFQELNAVNKKLVFSCGSGITACILALAANVLDNDNISVYDGSWTEYGTLTNENN